MGIRRHAHSEASESFPQEYNWDTGGPKWRFALAAFSLRNWACEGVREERMKSKFDEAVLQTADEWLLAQEALVAAKQVSEETEAEQEAVDIAGSRLVLAVTRWRSNGGLCR